MNKKQEQRIRVYNKFGGRCAYCGKEVKFKDLQIDHKIPRLNGYMPKTEDEENLMPSCRICNHYKRAFTLPIWRDMLKTIHHRIEKIYIVKVAMSFGIIEFKPFNGVFYFESLTQTKKEE